MSERLRPGDRARQELDQAEQWLGGGRTERGIIARALVAAVVFHATVLVARMPNWGPDPVRIEAPIEQAMKVQFLRPPAPPPPKTPEKPPEPEKKRVPRPDPTPDEPEPVKAPPPPPPAEPVTAAPAPHTGPIRVSAGQGPGLIKRVEPVYPPIARAARMEGTVVVDAIILKDGSVSEVKVLSSSNAMFDQACVDAVRRWRFTPSPQDVVLTVTVKFTLR
jgi:protein TonB